MSKKDDNAHSSSPNPSPDASARGTDEAAGIRSGAGNGEENYRPSPILDELSSHSEGRPPARSCYLTAVGTTELEWKR